MLMKELFEEVTTGKWDELDPEMQAHLLSLEEDKGAPLNKFEFKLYLMLATEQAPLVQKLCEVVENHKRVIGALNQTLNAQLVRNILK